MTLLFPYSPYIYESWVVVRWYFLKVKNRGMYLQKTAKMLLFAVTNIVVYSYDITFSLHFITFITGDWAALQPWLVRAAMQPWLVTCDWWIVKSKSRRGEGETKRLSDGERGRRGEELIILNYEFWIFNGM